MRTGAGQNRAELKDACVNGAMTEINTETAKPIKTGANPLGGFHGFGVCDREKKVGPGHLGQAHFEERVSTLFHLTCDLSSNNDCVRTIAHSLGKEWKH